MSETKKCATVKVGQLKELLKDADDEQDIRVWVEMQHEVFDENEPKTVMSLEGRRLIGVTDSPNEPFYCLVAGYYREDDEV